MVTATVAPPTVISRVGIGVGLASAIIAVLATLVTVALSFGGYREKIDANTKRVDVLETNVNQRLIRIEDKVDKLTDTMLVNGNVKRK